ncbi:hypothetical protein EDB86DRAFT_2829697 [Lactarius hatsudake]|nr:hypothetical protein EDB86DRAFT_2829697 [Lactarius hatsudake]
MKHRKIQKKAIFSFGVVVGIVIPVLVQLGVYVFLVDPTKRRGRRSWSMTILGVGVLAVLVWCCQLTIWGIECVGGGRASAALVQCLALVVGGKGGVCGICGATSPGSCGFSNAVTRNRGRCCLNGLRMGRGGSGGGDGVCGGNSSSTGAGNTSLRGIAVIAQWDGLPVGALGVGVGIVRRGVKMWLRGQVLSESEVLMGLCFSKRSVGGGDLSSSRDERVHFRGVIGSGWHGDSSIGCTASKTEVDSEAFIPPISGSSPSTTGSVVIFGLGEWRGLRGGRGGGSSTGVGKTRVSGSGEGTGVGSIMDGAKSKGAEGMRRRL